MRTPFPRLDQIRLDGGTQARAELSQPTIDEYAELYGCGTKMPPLFVFYDGTVYWLADGFHRWHGATKAGLTVLPCTVIKGTRRDAVLYSVGANAANGLRRTNADKRRAVTLLLNDEEWSKNADIWIANKCGVSQPFVGTVRSELITVIGSTPNLSESQERRKGRDGKWRRPPQPSKKPLEPVARAAAAHRRLLDAQAKAAAKPLAEVIQLYPRAAPTAQAPAANAEQVRYTWDGEQFHRHTMVAVGRELPNR